MMRVQPVFLASMLKPYHGDLSDSADAGSSRPPMTETSSLEREIIEILDHRTVHRPRAKPYYEFLDGQAEHSRRQPGSASKTWPDIRTLSRSISSRGDEGVAELGGGGYHTLPHFCRIVPHLYSVHSILWLGVEPCMVDPQAMSMIDCISLY